MFQKPLLLILIFVAFTKTHAQEVQIGFSEESQNIFHTVKDTLKIPISISLNGQYLPDKKNPIEIEISTNHDELDVFISPKKYKIFQSKTEDFLIFSNTSSKHHSNMTSVLDLIQKEHGFLTLKLKLVNSESFSVEDKKISINIKNNKQLVIFKAKEQKKPKAQYNLYIGTNFDLKDNIKANSFYSEIDVFLPEQFFYSKKNGEYRGSLRAGIYKNQSLSTIKERASDAISIEIIENLPDSDSITIHTKRVVRTPKITYDNLGLYAQIMKRFYKSKDDKFSIEIAAHAELIQRTETTNYEVNDFIDLGTSIISKDSLNDHRFRAMLSINRERTRKYYNSYFGIGIPVIYNSDAFGVFLNPIFGIGDSAPTRPDESSNKFFGIFQFHLTSNKFGIKLSGEVRKYFNAMQDPIISLNLSKSFDIDKLIQSNK